MSKYTTEVRYICENYAGLTESKGFDDIDSIIESARTKIFSFNYPIFDASYKPQLERKILKNFYTREICEETVGLWKLRLCNKLNEIMPYYNQLYVSELEAKDIDLINNTNITIDHNLKRTGSSTSDDTIANTEALNQTNAGTVASTETSATDTSSTQTNNTTTQVSGTDTNVHLFSATPQGALSEADLFMSSSGATYLTEASKDNNTNASTTHNTGTIGNVGDSDTTTTLNGTTSDTITSSVTNNGTNNNESSFNSEDDFIQHIFGKQGGISNAQAIAEARKTFLNIDRMILDDLRTLFFGLW